METSNFVNIKKYVNEWYKKEVLTLSANEQGPAVGDNLKVKERIQTLLTIQTEMNRLEKENPSLEDQINEGIEKATSTIKDGYKELHSVVERTVSDIFKATKPD